MLRVEDIATSGDDVYEVDSKGIINTVNTSQAYLLIDHTLLNPSDHYEIFSQDHYFILEI
jgi:hypothetical protein